jgi:hypothetical protein
VETANEERSKLAENFGDLGDELGNELVCRRRPLNVVHPSLESHLAAHALLLNI